MTLSPAQIIQRAADSGITLDGLTLLAAGADNVVYLARTAVGRRVVVKTARSGRSRYATAAWATGTAARRRIGVPRVLWHDESVCIEYRARGQGLAGAPDQLDTHAQTPTPHMLTGASALGAVLVRLHSVRVHGYGPLNAAGIGPFPDLAAALSASARRLADHPSPLLTTAAHALDEHAHRLADPGPRLLHGDVAARHTFVDVATGAVTALVDWESARGGDPLADVAAFTVREHPRLSDALTTAYFPAGATDTELWALTMHRIRIAAALTRFHHDQGEHASAARAAAVLTGDLAAARAGTPTSLPATSHQEHLR